MPIDGRAINALNREKVKKMINCEGVKDNESMPIDTMAGESKQQYIKEAAVVQRYSVRYGSYNARRYSKPWIARVSSWSVGGKPEMQWGSYLGDDSGGEVEILAHPGDIIRDGQRDYRGNGGSNDWSVAQEDGTLRAVTAAEARQMFRVLNGMTDSTPMRIAGLEPLESRSPAPQ